MRIIGGEYRGRSIKQPPFKTVRPTKDRIREAVFNMIAEKVPGARVMDLFAGSGAYGLESLSRGAIDSVFVDNDKRCANIINENITLLGVETQAKTFIEDVFRILELLGGNKEKFDLIFSDPPFNQDMAKKTLITISQYDILNHSGLLILEHHLREFVPEAVNDISILRQKTYKDILISIYIRK